MPDTAEYLAWIRQRAQSGDPLELQRRTLDTLAELIDRATPVQLATRPAPGKWSIGEILAHLAEDEIATAWRYRQMVEHDGIELAGFDQDLWARLGDYPARAPHDSLALFMRSGDESRSGISQFTWPAMMQTIWTRSAGSWLPSDLQTPGNRRRSLRRCNHGMHFEIDNIGPLPHPLFQ
jgi:hypothetical protein